MSKFQNDLAERLWDLSMSSFQTDDLGTSDSFGWHALFEDERAIICEDTEGFVNVTVYASLDALRERWIDLETEWREWNGEEYDHEYGYFYEHDDDPYFDTFDSDLWDEF